MQRLMGSCGPATGRSKQPQVEIFELQNSESLSYGAYERSSAPKGKPVASERRRLGLVRFLVGGRLAHQAPAKP